MDRPFFRPDISPSWHKSSERYALWPVAAGCHRSLLLLSRLLSPAMRPRLATFLPRLCS